MVRIRPETALEMKKRKWNYLILGKKKQNNIAFSKISKMHSFSGKETKNF